MYVWLVGLCVCVYVWVCVCVCVRVGLCVCAPRITIMRYFNDVVFVYVIAWVVVKFGINTTSVVLEMEQISRGEAE